VQLISTAGKDGKTKMKIWTRDLGIDGIIEAIKLKTEAAGGDETAKRLLQEAAPSPPLPVYTFVVYCLACGKHALFGDSDEMMDSYWWDTSRELATCPLHGTKKADWQIIDKVDPDNYQDLHDAMKRFTKEK